MPATYRKSDTGSRLSALQQRARAKPVDNFASIHTYYRSADLLLRQADVYRRAHNEDELYVMLLRFAGLVVETLPQHRAFVRSDAKYQQLKKALVDTYLPEAERLRASVQLRDQVDLLSRQGPFQPTKTAGTVLLSAGNLPEINWGWGDAAQRPVDAGAALGVPQPVGFDLLSSRAGAVSPADVAQAGSSPALVHPLAGSAHSAPTLLSLPELSTRIRLPTASHATLAKHALLPPSVTPNTQQQQQQQQQLSPAQPSPAQPPLYPELEELRLPPPQQQQQALGAALASLNIAEQPQGSQQQQGGQRQEQQGHLQPSPYGELQLGPQEVEVSLAPRPSEPLPPGSACCQPPPPGQQQAVVPALPISSGVAEVKRLQQLRDVHVSAALMDEFMRYAANNTRRNIESCGILAGTLSADDAVFTINTLIVPKQTGTSDTVEMLNEEEIFEVQDSRALYPLGWIHTHPSQTCFLSSTMLDEAVAIVMAPRDPSKRVGIFRLTTPGGLKLVQRCPQRGFHAHPPTDTGQPIYDLCRHVYLNPRLKHEVVDLR